MASTSFKVPSAALTSHRVRPLDMDASVSRRDDLGIRLRQDAEDAVRGGRLVIAHDGDLLADQRVDERRLADIRAADDGDEARLAFCLLCVLFHTSLLLAYFSCMYPSWRHSRDSGFSMTERCSCPSEALLFLHMVMPRDAACRAPGQKGHLALDAGRSPWPVPPRAPPR